MGDALRGPRLELALSNAMVRIFHEFYGKGPAQARTYVFDNYVFCMLDDVLTTVERTLVDGGDEDLVRQLRLTFEDVMTQTFTSEVEKLTGARVIGYHSQIVFEPAMAMEMFILDTGDGDPPVGLSEEAADVTSAALEDPGEVGDVDRLPGASKSVTPQPDVVLDRLGGRQQAHGSTRSAISNAMVRITRECYGRGPKRSKTYMADQYVFCVLEDLLTTVERTLLEAHQAPLVRHVRLRFQELKGSMFAHEIEQLTGRTVKASHSQIVFDPDVVFQLFVLEPEGEQQAESDVGGAAE